MTKIEEFLKQNLTPAQISLLSESLLSVRYETRSKNFLPKAQKENSISRLTELINLLVGEYVEARSADCSTGKSDNERSYFLRKTKVKELLTRNLTKRECCLLFDCFIYAEEYVKNIIDIPYKCKKYRAKQIRKLRRSVFGD